MRNLLTSFFLFALGVGAQDVDIENIDPDLLNNLTTEQIISLESQIKNEGNFEQNNEPINTDESLENKQDFVNSPELGSKFGYDFLNKTPTSITAFNDLPVPSDYKISLRDEISVILSGSKDITYNLRVNLDGTILFPDIGSIYVVGLTFEAVGKKIQSLINSSYVGVTSNISLRNLSAKKVTIVGAVEVPGTYLVNPFTTISNALAYSGGVKEYGSLREISLIKTNGTVKIFDLYDLLIFGNRLKDEIIDAGDTILVKGTSSFITISGEVIRPGIYEYLENDSISTVLNYSLGLSGSANKKNISIIKVDPNSLNLINETVDIEDTKKLNGILSLRAFPVGVGNKLDILVEGPLENSGYYKYEEYNYLKDLINDLKFTNNLYPYLAVIEQFDTNDFETYQHVFSLKDEETYQNIRLKSGDKIKFLSKGDYESVALLDFKPETKKLINDYTLQLNYQNLSYPLPVVGKYKIIDFLKFLGIDESSLNKNRLILTSAESILESIDLNQQLMMVEGQAITIFDESKLLISGPAKLRGSFSLNQNISLSDLLKIIEFDESIYPYIAVAEKFNPIDLTITSHLFNLNDKETHNFEADNYTKIFFFSRSNYDTWMNLEMKSITKNMIEEFLLRFNYKDRSLALPVYGQFELESLINFLGIDLTDVEKNRTTYVRPLSDETFLGDYQKIIINSERFHSVSLRFRETELINIKVDGEINFPGTITISKSNTLADVYDLMGGFTPLANQDGILLQRLSVQKAELESIERARLNLNEFLAVNAQKGNENVSPEIFQAINRDFKPTNLGRVSGDFSYDSLVIDNFLLEDGDTIFVPRKASTVTILGEVLNPNTVLHNKGYNLKKYIALAGGQKDFARTQRIYIIKANGLIERRRNLLFIELNRIDPGDTIIVPRKMNVSDEFGENLILWLSTLTNLSFSALAIENLKNN